MQNESERDSIAKEFEEREAKIAEEHRQEKSTLKSELQTQIEDVSRQLDDANERWDGRESLPQDTEKIKSL